MSGLQANGRAAAVAFMHDYGVDAGLRLQTYPGRPASIKPPCGFVDTLRETYDFTGPTIIQRTLLIECIVLHGLFDTADAAAQKDAFVDGIVEWARTRYHQIDPNSVVGLVAATDLPAYVPDWVAPEYQRTYYATQLTFRGEA